MNNASFDAQSYQDEPVRYPPLQVVDLVAEGDDVGQGYSTIVINRVNQHCLRLAGFRGVPPHP